MRLWKRASGVLKDQNSLWITSLSRRSTLRNPDIEAAVIKATSHDELCIDYKNFHRVLSWLRLSDVHVKPTVRSIAARLENTRNWIVALKGLMLMHGVISNRVGVVQLIGRLPFDLSNFKDGHSKLGKTWAHNTLIRAYYAFLDSKSVLLYGNLRETTTSSSSSFRRIRGESSMTKDIMILQKVQGLIDLLLQIKPLSGAAANVFLIVEAMDGIVMESFDIHSRMCKMIANVVSRIQTVSKAEACMILGILQKAVEQGDNLSLYFELCRDIGVERALEIPDPPRIQDGDLELLQEIVNSYGVPQASKMDLEPRENNKAIVVREEVKIIEDGIKNDERSELKTIITNNWEKFDEDLKLITVGCFSNSIVVDDSKKYAAEKNPFFTLTAVPHESHHAKKGQELPDLISFM